MREALKTARNQFAAYAELHRAKGLGHEEKAARNERLVAMCDEALARPEQEPVAWVFYARKKPSLRELSFCGELPICLIARGFDKIPLYTGSAPTQSAEMAAVTAARDQLRAEVERLRASSPKPISELLTAQEASFVARVYHQPGSKLNGDGIASHWEDDGTEHGNMVCHWHKPEELGLIKCVGSYKWEPTEKLMLVANICPEEAPAA